MTGPEEGGASMNIRGAVSFVIYAACVPVANYLVGHIGPVSVGFGLLAPAGVFVAGVAFTARDGVQVWMGRRWVLAAIALGTVLAFMLSASALAMASGCAFLLAEILDMAVWTPLESRSRVIALALSNTVGSVVDSLVFLWMAFHSLTFLPGQVLGKVLMIAPVVVVMSYTKARRRVV